MPNAHDTETLAEVLAELGVCSFREDVNDASMCMCGLPALNHDQIAARVVLRDHPVIARIVQARVSTTCIGSDPTCPCQDGDVCHYKAYGDRPAMQARAGEGALRERIEALAADTERLAMVISKGNFPSSWVQGESLLDWDGEPLSPDDEDRDAARAVGALIRAVLTDTAGDST